jgi:hypothetical protein
MTDPAKTEDRELLEMAAKAAGVKRTIEWLGHHEYTPEWNPLTDDGDALRLAVKLNLDVDICFSCVGVCYVFTNVAGEEDADNVMEQVGDDAPAATRRAIVRAAAEIGKAMP